MDDDPVSDAEAVLARAAANRRHTSLKVTHYPILLRKKNHPGNEISACVKWTTGTPLPEDESGETTWMMEEMESTTSVQNSNNVKLDSTTPSDVSTTPKSSRDKFFGARQILGPRNTITLGADLCADSGSMLHPQHKSPFCPVTQIGPEHSELLLSVEGAHRNRKQWSLSPAAFHQSFDDRRKNPNMLSNSCGNLNEQVIQGCQNGPNYRRRAAICSGDTSKGAFAGGYGSGNNSANCGSGYSPSSSKPPALGGRSPQSSFDSNGDVGQIGLNFMRINGAYAPFKTLLTKDRGQHQNQNKDLNVACNSTGIGPTTTAVPSTGIARVGSCHTPFNVEQPTAKRKESWTQILPRKTSDPVRISIDGGDQQSKKSLSLVLSDDLENGKQNVDDSKTPLMKENEKGGRLIQRQQIFAARRTTSDYALFFAILGIVIMIFENELSANHVYSKNSLTSIVLRAIIMLTTVALLAAVIKFHVHEVQLFMNANSAEDWRIALTFRRCLQVAVELAACSICPLPFDWHFEWTTIHSDGVTVTTTSVPLDVMLSIPMFFRLYWLCRVMLLHSRLFTDASSRSIAGLNRVTFNARFILKTLMTLCPGTMLMVFTASLWVMAAWVLRLCERHHIGDPINHHALKHQNYLNSLWLIAITFLSIGYGDIVPITYCGRAVAVVTGILGTVTSSMVVAVIARKLELSRAEKHVHNFMIDTQLTKQLKHSAANVLRETWLIYKYRRLVNKIDPGKIRHHQRKFLMAIYALRKVKRDQRKLAENSVSLGDVAKTTSNSYEMIHDIHSTQEGLALRMTAVEHQLSDIQREISQLADVVRSAIVPREGRRRYESGETSPNPRDSVRRRKTGGEM